MNANEKTALVVDDDPDIRKLISLYLEKLGFAVTQVSDGRKAMEKLDQARPSLLCLDLMLPELSGYDVCEHVAKGATLKGLPIMVMSARGMPEDRAQAEELGVKRYLVKPFSQAEFIQAVRETLEQEAP